jgi:Skp family chaperone for outer membrane proteins
VKRTFLPSAIAAAIFATLAWACFSGSPASAQQPAGASMQPAGRIALVDVNHLMKNHVRMKGQLTELNNSMEAISKQFDEQLKHIQNEEAALKSLSPSSQGYQQKEEQIVAEKANLQGQASLKQKEFMQQRGRIYAATYKEIQGDVAAYCRQYGFSLAMTFDSDPVNADNPQDVIRGITRNVISFDGNMAVDITNYLLPRYAPPETARPVGVGPR